MLRDIQAGKLDTKAFQEAIFISVPAAAQRIHIQRLSLYTILGRLQKQETKFNAYIYGYILFHWLAFSQC
jgi:hypothetical protein